MSIDASGGWLAIGAPAANEVKLYSLSGETWNSNSPQTLSGSTYGAGGTSLFGQAVAIDVSGTTGKLVVGAPDAAVKYRSDVQADGTYLLDLGTTGVVFSFALSGTTWSYSNTLMPYDTPALATDDMPEVTSLNTTVPVPDAGKVFINGTPYGIGRHSYSAGNDTSVTLGPFTRAIFIDDDNGLNDSYWSTRENNTAFSEVENLGDNDFNWFVVGTYVSGSYGHVGNTRYDGPSTNTLNGDADASSIFAGTNSIVVAVDDPDGAGDAIDAQWTLNNSIIILNDDLEDDIYRFWVSSTSTPMQTGPIDYKDWDDLNAARWGWSLDIVGDQVMVGAPGSASTSPNRVAVYDLSQSQNGYSAWDLFVGFSGSTTTTSDIPTASAPLRPVFVTTGSGDFGQDVAANGSTAFFASRPTDGTTGKVQEYVLSGTTWNTGDLLTAPSGSSNFGADNTLVVRANRLLVGATGNAGTATLYTSAGSSLGLQYMPYEYAGLGNGMRAVATSTPLNFGAGGQLISEGFVLVGTANTGDQPNDVYNFRQRGPEWTPIASNDLLVPELAARNGEVGSSVAIDGDTIVVGARDYDNRGAVFVFTTADGGSSYDLQAVLQSDDIKTADLFGATVALSGDSLVVGAPGHDSASAQDVGAVYFFQRLGESWTQTTDFLGASTGAGLGNDVDIFGTDAIVGAPGANTVYFYAYNGATWTQSDSETGTGTLAGLFGAAVAMDQTSAVVGAPTGNSGTGAAAVYVKSGSTWTQQGATLLPSLTSAETQASGVVVGSGARFGSAVDIDGDRIAIGAPGAEVIKSFDGSSASIVNVSNNTIQISQVFLAGDEVVYSNGGGTSIGGLTNDGVYYVGAISGDKIKLFTTRNDAIAGTTTSAINLTALGTGNQHQLKPAFDGSSASVVSLSNNTIQITQPFQPGDEVIYRNGGGTSIGGLTHNGVYYVGAISGDTVKLFSTRDAAVAGTNPIDLTSLGSGNKHQLQGLAGAVYTYERTGTTWGDKEVFAYPTGVAGDHFGASVALDGDQLVVGAYGRDVTLSDGIAFNAGSSSVVSVLNDRIQVSQAFQPGDAVIYSNGGGTSIGGLINNGVYYVGALSGSTVKLFTTQGAAIAGTNAVNLTALGSGNQHQLKPVFTDLGAAYAYHFDDGQWQLDPPGDGNRLTAADGFSGDNVGFAVAVSGDEVIVGAPQLNGRPGDAIDTDGAGYFYVRRVSAPITVVVPALQQELIAGANANKVSGTLGAVTGADLYFFDIPDVTLRTGSGADQITVGAGGLNAFGLQDFTIETQGGDDRLIVQTDQLNPTAVGTFDASGNLGNLPAGSPLPSGVNYAAVTGDFSFDGGIGSNTLSAAFDTNWTLNAATSNAGTLTAGNGEHLSFTNVQAAALTGGAGVNRIEVQAWEGSGSLTLDGAGASDQYQVAAAGFDHTRITETVNNGTLDTLTLLGTAQGDSFRVDGTEIILGTKVLDYSGIEVLNIAGGSGSDGFAVRDISAGTITTINLNGEGDSDVYQIIDGTKSANVYIHDGGPLPEDGGGTDRLEVPAGTTPLTSPITVSNTTVSYDASIEQVSAQTFVTALTVGTSGNDTIVINGSTITVNGVPQGLTTVLNLTIDGGDGDDSITIQNVPSWLTLVVNGGAGTDTIIEQGGATTWDITGSGVGSVSGADRFTFTGIENITTGTGADTFKFTDGGSLAGNLSADGGSDTLDYSQRTIAVNFTLGGSATAIVGTVTGIDAVIGTSAVDTLTDANSVWHITGVNSGDIDGVFQFTGMENLVGDAANDTFIVSSGARITGSINGGGGTNLLIFETSTANDTITVTGGSVTINSVSQSYLNIATLRVNSNGGADSVTVNPSGSNLPSTIEINSGDGDDSLVVNLVAGVTTTIAVDGGAPSASDSLTVNGTAANDVINVNGSKITYGSMAISLKGIESLSVKGGAGADQITLSGNPGSASVELLGEGGDDTIGVTYPVTANNLVVNGGAGSNNQLNVTLTSADETVAVDGDSIDVTGTTAVQYSNFATVTLNTGSGADLVTVNGTAAATQINAGLGNDTINIRAIGTATTVNAGSGNDTINVGSLAPNSNGNVNAISALLTINGEGNSDTLNVDDSGDPNGNNGTLTATALTGLGMSRGIVYATLENLNINLGSGADTFAITSTHTGATVVNSNGGSDTINVQGSAGTMTVNAGVGGDTINVQAIGGATTVNAGAGNDTINVGSLAPNANGNVNGLNGLLTINGEDNSDTLNVDDSGDTTANSGTLTDTTLSGLGISQGIVYDAVEALIISLGSGGDTFTIASTHVGTTQLNTNAGDDTLNVRSIAGTTTVNAGLGDDTINVGSLAPQLGSGVPGTPDPEGQSQGNASGGGDLNAINALLTVNGGGNSDTLYVDDTGEIAPNIGTLTATTLTGLGMAQGIVYGTLEALNIGLGLGGDTFTIASTHTGATTLETQDGDDTIHVQSTSGTTTINAGADQDTINVRAISGATTVNAGAGNDTINVGSLAPNTNGNVNAISALLTVNGNGETDTLNVDDSGDVNGNNGTLTATTLSGLGMAQGIVYGTLETLNIGLGSGGDNFTIASTHNGTTVLNSNNGDDTINVQTISAATTVNAGAGNDTINVGSLTPAPGGTVNGISDLLTINGEGNSDTLNVDDSGDASANIGTLTATALTGLGMSEGIVYGTLESVNINLGSGADIFTIISTHAGTSTLESNGGDDTINVQSTSGVTTINAGADQDTVNVRGTGAATTVNAGSGDDTVNVGSLAPASGGNVNAINALLTVNGNGESDTLNVDDTGDVNGNNGTLTATTLTGLAMSQGIVYGTLETLNIGLGAGGDTFTIASTHGASTVVNSNGGNDTINVRSTDGATTVNAGSGDDTVNVGSLAPASGGNVNAINALLTVNGEGESDTLNVDDTGDVNGNNGTLTATTLTGLGMAQGIVYGALETLNIGLGAGGDTFTIASTHGASTVVNSNGGDDTINVRSTDGATTVNAGAGADTVNVGSLAPASGGNVNAINALLTINGDGESDALNVDDSGDVNGNNGMLTATTLTGLGMAQGIVYGTLETLNIGLGSGGDTFTIASTHGDATVLDSNGGNDIVNLLSNAGVTTVNSGNGADTVNIVSNGAETTVNSGDDGDTINVQAINALTTINAGTGVDTVNVGSVAPAVGGNVNAIGATLIINGDGEIDTLNVDDTGDNSPNTLNLTGTTITGLGMSEGITYGTTEFLNIGMGSGGNLVNIQATSAATSVNTGAGDDFIVVGSLAPNFGGTLNSIDGELTLGGEVGVDILYADDSGDTQPNTGTLTATTLIGLGMAGGMTYGNMEIFEISLGSGDDTFDVTGTMRREDFQTITVLNTGAGSDHVTVSLTEGVDGLFAVHLGAGDDQFEGSNSTFGLIVFGDEGNDRITGGDGSDILFGDHGEVDFVNSNGEVVTRLGQPILSQHQTDGVSRGARFILSVDTLNGGNDIIDGRGGSDALIGGAAGDEIHGGANDDWIAGDNAQLNFVPISGNDGATRINSITTLAATHGGADSIYGDGGADVIFGGAFSDRIDGNEGDDLIFGDAVQLLWRAGNITNPRFQTLSGTQIYSSAPGNNAGADLVDGTARNYRNADGTAAPAWTNWLIQNLYHTLAIQTLNDNSFGNDYIAGGAGNDEIFGQLGDDIIQGDGSADVGVGALRDAGNNLFLIPSFEASSDGDDYIEGNGGNDVIFGNLGQDDIIGGSSDLFGLTTRKQRLDGSDLIFGGAGTDIGRNDAGSVGGINANQLHARDADVILGDNGNIYRLVGVNGSDTGFLRFNYDNYNSGSGAANKILARATRLLDYTAGGFDFNAVSAARDLGAGDEIHGESGDDSIHGMAGNDLLFGDGQDDAIIGGHGADWVSSGQGDDGILGDDGRIFISRNSSTVGEPLYGIAPIPAAELNLLIQSNNPFQAAVINVSGQLKYRVDLTPQNLDPANPTNTQFRPLHANDIVYGGLGNDAIHGGAGDDAISGAEAPTLAYTNSYDRNGNLIATLLQSDFFHPYNPGNVLGYSPTTTKFAQYDANDPMRKILLTGTGALSKSGSGSDWLLNIADSEGPIDSRWIIGTTYTGAASDGDDHLFGDLGNDWLVGGTGRDTEWGGWGDDLLSMDDKLGTNGGLNDQTDTNPSYEDFGFGGAGRDVMILNTNGDRAIDGVGEFNSYITPYAQNGMPSITRSYLTLSTFLLQLSKSQGADQTLGAQYGSSAARNGEPFGEIGLVLQQDAAWGAQSGSPRDPQNLAGSAKADVKTSAGIQPLYATAENSAPAQTVESLDDNQFATIVTQAKQLWSEELGSADNRLATLDSIQFVAGNLPEDKLGVTYAGMVIIDSDAAGYGWFVDSTPYESSEFANIKGTLSASRNGAAYGRMDLLTTVMHELGHVLGYEHGADELMGATLATGVRELDREPEYHRAFDVAAPASSNCANGVNEKTSIDWDGGKFELATPLGWNNGWSKRSGGANFPEFVYAGFDNQDGEQNVFGPKKKRLEDATEVAFEPQGQIDWHIEIG